MRLIARLARCAVLVLSGLICSTAAFAQPAPSSTFPSFLDQGWNDDDRTWFYTTTQGSQMMPYYWFLALERPDSNEAFLKDKLARFGYLPPYAPGNFGNTNPDGLPIGFVKDDDPERGAWVGMTCAACHTNQVNFAGKVLQIDGGPTNADFFALIKELGVALEQTASSDEKFKRFADEVRRLTPKSSRGGSVRREIDELAERVRRPNAASPGGRELGDELSAKLAERRKIRDALAPKLADALRERTAGSTDEQGLREKLREFSKAFTEFVNNSRTDVAWGPARLDAFGEIFNRATAIDLNEPSNNHAPNAPVSYPFLWDTSHHDWVQWNGSAPNILAIERLARNVGEVLGVFGHTEIKKSILPPFYYKSSVDRLNLLLIEQRLRKLTSPLWPRDLAKIDPGKAAAGKKYYDQYCLGCHAIAIRQGNRFQAVTLTPLAEIGTDPMMAKNAKDLRSKSGILEGVSMPPLIGDPLEAETSSFAVVGNIVVGAILAPPDWLDVPKNLDEQNRNLIRGVESHRTKARDVRTDLRVLARNQIDLKTLLDQRKAGLQLQYKARPLDGIWATAPYLHNGSVPNLYQLLLPSDKRDGKFSVGSREIDTKNVGFKSSSSDGAFQFDTSLPGNSNKGHEGRNYGTDPDQMTEDQRWQLIEYLKTL
jgi:processive rubber oxygenase RoxA-like protein